VRAPACLLATLIRPPPPPSMASAVAQVVINRGSPSPTVSNLSAGALFIYMGSFEARQRTHGGGVGVLVCAAPRLLSPPRRSRWAPSCGCSSAKSTRCKVRAGEREGAMMCPTAACSSSHPHRPLPRSARCGHVDWQHLLLGLYRHSDPPLPHHRQRHRQRECAAVVQRLMVWGCRTLTHALPLLCAGGHFWNLLRRVRGGVGVDVDVRPRNQG
jgi:hypothetical protein